MTINRAFPTMRATLTMKISSLLEREYGHYAIYYDAGDVAGLSPFLSLKLCAEMAGLGTRALAGGVILNRDHGLLSFACTITSMPLRADGPLKEPVCPDEVCVKLWDEKESTPCLAACPKCLSGELTEGKIRWMEYRRHLCVPQANWISAFQHNLNRILEEKHVERRRQMIYGSLFGAVVKNLIFAREIVGRCYECLRLCPVCVRTRVLRPKAGE